MIAKRSRSRGDRKSGSVADLIHYIADTKQGGEKVEGLTFTNCDGTTLDEIIMEMDAVQGMNTRSKKDKSYHLIFSFPVGEKPESGVLADIESVLCDRLGYRDHQRVSSVHTDTDNLHVHVAINKIHPRTFNAVEPYFDHYKLSDVCRDLEQKYGLQVDRGIEKDRDRGLSDNAAEMEAHSGKESFENWVSKKHRAGILAVIDQAGNWGELQTGLAQYHLEIKQRGAGMVLADRAGNGRCKLSQLGRGYGAQALQARLGAFSAGKRAMDDPPAYRYVPRPVQRGADDYYRQYQDWRNERVLHKRLAMAEIRAEQFAVRDEYRRRVAAIKADRWISRRGKRAAYQKLAKARAAALAQASATAARQRKALHAAYPLHSWQQWLVEKAMAGDDRALGLLRKGRGSKAREPDAIRGEACEQSGVYPALRPRVRANGDVLYQIGEGVVRDSGQTLRLDGDQTAAMVAALQIASQRFSRGLTLTGSTAFQRSAVELSVEHGIDISFADPALQASREALLSGQNKRDVRDGVLGAFLQSRNSIRDKHSDILYHREWSKADAAATDCCYQGRRRLADGSHVVLLSRNDEMLVRRVSAAQARGLGKELTVGDPVQVSASGAVRRRSTQQLER